MRTLAPPTHRGALHWKGFFKLSTKLLKAVTLCCSKQSSEVGAHFRLAEFPTRAVEPQLESVVLKKVLFFCVLDIGKGSDEALEHLSTAECTSSSAVG